MGEISKKLIVVLVAIIIFIASYAVITQFQIFEIHKDDEKQSLIAKIFVDRNSGTVPFAVNYSALVTNSKGDVGYSWDFGDGESSTETNPTHIYEKNGSYICKVQVKDESGKKSSDSIEIISKANQRPTVSIEAKTDKPRRPQSFILEYILPAISLHVEFFNSNDFRELQKKGLLNPLFKNMDSFYSVEAYASDPDGDEIVSYNWTLRPPSYTTRLKKTPVDPVYYYYGKKIDIPAIDIYPAVDYSLTLTVTDSSGEERSENYQFQVQKSNKRSTFEGIKYTITNSIDKWVSQWHSNIIIGGIVLGSTAVVLRVIHKYMPEALSLPSAKLLAMILLELILQTSPDEYTDESYADVIQRIVFKDRLIFRNLNPEKFKKWFDIAEEIFGKIPLLQELALTLQLLEEEIGLDNNRPNISYPYPENNAKYVHLNTQKVFITVEDLEGDSFSVQIFDENGYIDNVSGYYPMGQHNGSFSANLNTPLPPNTDITWKVLVIDENNKEVTETYKFTTHYE